MDNVLQNLPFFMNSGHRDEWIDDDENASLDDVDDVDVLELYEREIELELDPEDRDSEDGLCEEIELLRLDALDSDVPLDRLLDSSAISMSEIMAAVVGNGWSYCDGMHGTTRR